MLSITDATDVKAKVNTWRWKDDEENPGGKKGPHGTCASGPNRPPGGIPGWISFGMLHFCS